MTGLTSLNSYTLLSDGDVLLGWLRQRTCGHCAALVLRFVFNPPLAACRAGHCSWRTLPLAAEVVMRNRIEDTGLVKDIVVEFFL